MSGVIIVGAGHAGFTLAAALRAGGYAPTIRIVGEEPAMPYERPPLSKAYLLGTRSREELMFRQEAFYAENGIEMLLGRRAVHLAPADRKVHLTDGAVLSYDHLILATGACNRPLPVPGGDLGLALGLRDLQDAGAIADRLATARAVAVVGGGFIGLEVAAIAAKQGKTVTVVEAQPRLLARAVPAVISDFFASLHRGHGVRLVLNSGVLALARQEDGRTLVETTAGPLIADLAVFGIGVTPNVALALEAGLAVTNGITVDAQLRTSDPAISAIGDCACFPGIDGLPIRIESVQNATDQARHVAQRILGTAPPAGFRAVPWFWSDQYDCKLQIAGLCANPDGVMVKRTGERALSVALLASGRLAAVHSVNLPAEHMFARKRLAGEPIATVELEARGYVAA